MARRGRKRSDGDRYPCGKIIPRDESLVAKLARARQKALRGLGEPGMQTELDFLYLAKGIEGIQYLAGKELERRVKEFRLVKLGQSGNAKVSQLQPHIRGTSSDKEFSPEYIGHVEDDYDETYSLVHDAYNSKMWDILMRLCVDNGYLMPFEQEESKKGLSLLAQNIKFREGTKAELLLDNEISENA